MPTIMQYYACKIYCIEESSGGIETPKEEIEEY